MGPIRTVNLETEFVEIVKNQINIFKQLHEFSATQQDLITNGEFEKLIESLNEKKNLVQTIKQLGKKLSHLHLKLEKNQESADSKLPANLISNVHELSDLIESVLALENHNLSTLDTVSLKESFAAGTIQVK